MAILRTEAVVMKGWKLGETSKILSLFTRDFGKVKVVAKGGRGSKSKFKGCLEPLTHLRIFYYDKRTRDLQLLSQADLIDPGGLVDTLVAFIKENELELKYIFVTHGHIDHVFGIPEIKNLFPKEKIAVEAERRRLRSRKQPERHSIAAAVWREV